LGRQGQGEEERRQNTDHHTGKGRPDFKPISVCQKFHFVAGPGTLPLPAAEGEVPIVRATGLLAADTVLRRPTPYTNAD
jgi:hypothetical protein